MSPLAASNTPPEGGWGAEEVGIDWNVVIPSLDELEVVAEATLDVGDVEYDVEIRFVLVADVLSPVVLELGAMVDEAEVAGLGEKET